MTKDVETQVCNFMNKNKSLIRMDITRNKFSENFSEMTLNIIKNENKNIEYLGDLSECYEMNVGLIYEINHFLNINKLLKSGEYKK